MHLTENVQQTMYACANLDKQTGTFQYH